MRLTLDIDGDLLDEALKVSGVHERDTSALIHKALNLLIEQESARRLAMLGGTEPDLTAPPRRRPEVVEVFPDEIPPSSE